MNISNTKHFKKDFVAAMKFCAAMLFSFLMCYGCIFETPRNDIFYRTLWTSDKFPYGSITLEFLCGNNVSIKGDGAIGSYGNYEPAAHTAHFNSLELTYNTEHPASIIIEEAYRIGDDMQITWHLNDSETSSTTIMTRLKAYQ